MKKSLVSLLLVAFSVGFLIAFPVILSLVIGIGIDTYFHTSPTYTIVGVVMGFLGGFFNVFRLLKKFF